MDANLITQIRNIKYNKGNFQTIKNKIGEERLKDFFTTLYPKFTITEIEAITEIPDSTLERWFQQLRIPFIRHRIRSKAFVGNENSEIIVAKNGITFRAVKVNITPQLAYLIGFTLGDGSVQQYMIEVFNKDRKLREILFNCLKPYGTITKEERENGLWKLRLSNGVIANLIKNENGIREDTLDYIFSNDELARNFIAAFWDAEGSVLYQREKKYYNLYLYNSNKFILNKIKEFLFKKEIKFSTHSRKTRDKNCILNNHIVQSKKILHRINIHKASWPIWINEIGLYMNHSKKKEMIKAIKIYLGGK
ncbi:hypothetical protein J4230_04070 [Candidatus Woesearchaeota archaeon]|nr:hypothetical protein [Candidatus Woesearchaeota archaeon]